MAKKYRKDRYIVKVRDYEMQVFQEFEDEFEAEDFAISWSEMYDDCVVVDWYQRRPVASEFECYEWVYKRRIGTYFDGVQVN